jgi:Tfp pilus assembly protein PilN
MIQFNLLPDIKREFIKARRLRRSVTLVSMVSAGSAVAVLLILFGVVNGAQKKRINDLNNDVKKYSTQLKEIPDLDKILTIQNQLAGLTVLHDKKPASTRLFGYVSSLTPALANIKKLTVDFAGNVVSIEGTADTLNTVNKFADTLKFTDFKSPDGSVGGRAFSGVVLQSFTRDSATTTYQIDASFNPTIFDRLQQLSLIVPDIISTRSETEKPTALFGGDQGGQQ